VFDEEVVGLAEVAEHRIFVDREYEIPAVDLRAGVQTAHGLLVSGEGGNSDECVGDLILAVSMRGNCSMYTCNNAHLLDTGPGAGRFDLATVRFLRMCLTVAETEPSVHSDHPLR